MGKLGGLLAIATAALVLSGCGGTGESTEQPSSKPAVEITTQELHYDPSKADAFVAEMRTSGSSYGSGTEEGLRQMSIELCQHYDGGFATEDLRQADGERLAIAGETARKTVCPDR